MSSICYLVLSHMAHIRVLRDSADLRAVLGHVAHFAVLADVSMSVFADVMSVFADVTVFVGAAVLDVVLNVDTAESVVVHYPPVFTVLGYQQPRFLSTRHVETVDAVLGGGGGRVSRSL